MFLARPQIDSFIDVSKLFMRMIMSLSTFYSFADAFMFATTRRLTQVLCRVRKFGVSAINHFPDYSFH